MFSTQSKISSTNSNISSTTNSNMSSIEHLPVINDVQVQTYEQFRRKILTNHAKQQAEQSAEKFDLNVALVVLDDEAPVVEKPSRKWYGFSWGKDRRGIRESVQQRHTLQEPYTYQGTTGYGKLAAYKGR